MKNKFVIINTPNQNVTGASKTNEPLNTHKTMQSLHPFLLTYPRFGCMGNRSRKRTPETPSLATSPERRPEGVLIRSPNHLTWRLLMRRSAAILWDPRRWWGSSPRLSPEEAHFGRLYQKSFRDDSYLMTVGEGQNVAGPVNWWLCFIWWALSSPQQTRPVPTLLQRNFQYVCFIQNNRLMIL